MPEKIAAQDHGAHPEDAAEDIESEVASVGHSGGIFWVGAMILGSYFLGHLIPNIAQRIHYVIAVVILLSILPVIISLVRARGEAAAPTGAGK